jgi:HSP20 family protein
MSIVRYDPVHEAMHQLRHQLFHHQHQHQDAYQEDASAAAAWTPLVDIFEDAEGITLKVELPEVEADDVDIQVEGNTLTLRGDRKLENAARQEGYHRVERSYGSFARRFTLPSTVETSAVSARCRDGVLRIFLPKKAETKPRQVRVFADPGVSLPGKQ